MDKKLNIFWFRRDLRLHDNHGLFRALSEDLPVLPIFIFDKNILDKLEEPEDARVEFIHNEIKDLKNKLEKSGSSLIVRYGRPEKIFEELTEEYDIAGIFSNYDHEPYGRERDKKIGELAEKKGVEFRSFRDHIIFDPSGVLKDDGNPYTVFTPYKNKWLKLFKRKMLKEHPSEEKTGNFFKISSMPFPGLEEMGFKPAGIEIPPREFPEKVIKSYDKNRDIPGIRGTTRLGIHLRFGTISIRKLMERALDLNKTYAEELIWREFFMMIMWHFPVVENRSFKKKYENIPWRNNEDEFRAWCEGKTGYPIVDAGMRELNQTGFMHNRVRMITASFLTKHLLIDWRWGEAYFGKKLLDYELSSNNGGWQWAAGSGCDAAPYFRIFNPESQTKKFDPEHQYISKWVPEADSEHYPPEIVNHREARERALSTYKSALN